MKPHHIFTALTLTLAACASTHRDVGSDETPMHKAAQAGDHAAMQLPPGWTAEDMQACLDAGMVGEKHKQLTSHEGKWMGTCTMWMAPDMPAMEPGACKAKITTVMDGRFAKWEFDGEMPGMGPYNAVGFFGFENGTQKYVSSWLDNHSTQILHGEGTASADGNTITWTYRYHCPIRKGPASMREIQTYSKDMITLETYMADPKSGKEYKMMRIEMKQASS